MRPVFAIVVDRGHLCGALRPWKNVETAVVNNADGFLQYRSLVVDVPCAAAVQRLRRGV